MRNTEPPWGWGAPSRRPAPKADVLRLALYLLFLGSPRCAPALPSCKEEEFPVGTECCPKCSPGYHVRQACGELTGTVCVPCPPRTYTAHHNGLSECLPCRVCDPAMGLVTRQNCSRTENTLCGCSRGHFCEDGDHCAACRSHTLCPPGQRVQERGTERQDTVCQDCPPETFSPSGSLEECQPWTKCSGWFTTETPGTSSSDVTCSSKTPQLLWGLIFVIASVFILGLVIYKRKRRKASGAKAKREARDTEGEATVLQAPPDVTTVAVEETAPKFPGRDPNR
ncbi:PREDICTED: tumor necrosis factor receptor superfamily member 14 isoform X2 [Propithecus coquereli]|uniref:tumor necrosis factor receptor superfamily member 14 isoform X2 n=1 Tax=Propithecus coquereli TaxID=379532 RepID=UPI00063ED805|nr:PREDICTED: tumor necrosis factor receptor superfamily member 14 isoform X2 [Propithecus coquereli]